jgi:hypothetical protein
MNNAMKTTLVLATLAVASLAPAQVAIFSDRSEARPVAIEPAKTWALNYGWQVSACGLLAPLGSVRIGAALTVTNDAWQGLFVGCGTLFGDTWTGALRDLRPGIVIGWRF